MDLKSAYLQDPPKENKTVEEHRLFRPLYGLKEAPVEFERRFRKAYEDAKNVKFADDKCILAQQPPKENGSSTGSTASFNRSSTKTRDE